MTSFEQRTADWLPVAEAVRRVVAAAPRSEPVDRPLLDALGLALAEDLVAGATLPPFDNSAMDGYAVRGEDVRGARPEAPVVLRVVGVTRAGDPPREPLGPGEAVRIMTGAPVPRETGTVVRVEHTDAEAEEDGRLSVQRDDDVGRHVRPAGRDMRAGDVVLRAGTSVTPGVVAVAAALGAARVPVHGPPRVGILSSGEELRGPGGFDDVAAGRAVPDTNGPSLAAAVREARGVPVRLGIARDDPEDIRERVQRAVSGCDVLVTTGGASMGEADLFKRALVEMGLEVDFWRVRIRPGSPFSLAHLARPGRPPLPVLGLPGNPASAFVTFQIFVRPLILEAGGHERIHRPVLRAVAGEPLPSTARLTHFHRVELERPAAAGVAGSSAVARLAGPQSSGLVGSLGRAHGLAVVPEGTESVDEGEEVEVVLLDDAPGTSPLPGYRSAATPEP